MDDSQWVMIAIAAGASLAGVFCVLVRMRMEKDRLFGRYYHLKAVWKREEDQRRRALEEAARTARAVSVAPEAGAAENQPAG